jgi:hypothetical protein
MTPIIEDSVLGTDLDAQFHSLLNVASLDPPPPNLATIDDVRLTDVRAPLDGSVVNASVAADAAIDQSKINFNGQIPTAWMGTSSTQAAQGDLAEYIANKNVPGGYVGLDSAGRIPTSALPDGAGLATLTSVGITLPPELHLGPGDPNPITGSGTWRISWLDMGGAAWFGALAAGPPAYQFGPIPVSLVPNLNAGQVTSGQFPPERMTAAIYGAGSAPGAVPDPGPSTGDPTDYLSRSMIYRPAPSVSAVNQPTLPDPSTSVQPDGTNRKVFAGSDIANVVFFWSFTSSGSPFTEFPNPGYVIVNPSGHAYIYIYSSRSGWNNSAIVTQSLA